MDEWHPDSEVTRAVRAARRRGGGPPIVELPPREPWAQWVQGQVRDAIEVLGVEADDVDALALRLTLEFPERLTGSLIHAAITERVRAQLAAAARMWDEDEA